MPITYEHRMNPWVQGMMAFVSGAGRGADAAELAQYKADEAAREQRHETMQQMAKAGQAAATAGYQHQTTLQAIQAQSDAQYELFQKKAEYAKALETTGFQERMSAEGQAQLVKLHKNTTEAIRDPNNSWEVKMQVMDRAREQAMEIQRSYFFAEPRQPTVAERFKMSSHVDEQGNTWVQPREWKQYTPPKPEGPSPKDRQEQYQQAKASLISDQIATGATSLDKAQLTEKHVFQRMKELADMPVRYGAWQQQQSRPEVAAAWTGAKPAPREPTQFLPGGGRAAGPGELAKASQAAVEATAAIEAAADKRATYVPLSPQAAAQADEVISDLAKRVDDIAIQAGGGDPATWSPAAKVQAAPIAQKLMQAVKARYAGYNEIPPQLRTLLSELIKAGLAG